MPDLPLSVEERLAALEAVVNKLKGPPMDLLLQEGYFQIGSSDLAGSQRFDSKGHQIATNGLDTGSVFFTEHLVPDPDSETYYAELQGTVSPSTPVAQIYGISYGANGTIAYFGAATDGSTPAAFLGFTRSGDSVQPEARWFRWAAGVGAFRLSNGLLYFQGLSSDPSPLVDGVVWYNTTDDQFKFYENGEIKTLGGGGMATIVKEADETVTTSTTLQNDDELLFAVAANEVWQFEGVLSLSAPTAADFKMSFTGPTGAVGSFVAIYEVLDNAGGIPPQALSAALGGTTQWEIGQDGVGLRFYGAIHNGANAGNLQLQWAQRVSSGSTTVRAGSYIKYILADN